MSRKHSTSQKRLFRAAASFLLVILLISSIGVHTLAAEAEQAGIELSAETVEAFLESFFSSPEVQPHVVGASVVVVKGDEILALKGHGYADIAEQKEVDPSSTVFRIASVSKTFTAVAIMQLVEQGKIDLTANVQAYLGDIEVVNPYDTPLTVEHLLLHQSGLQVRDLFPEDLHTDFDRFVEIEDYVRQHMPPVVREPGTAYMYDNFGYLLLGLIVQNVSEMPYLEYMQQHIFEPLDFESSGFLLEGDLLENLATGYDAANEAIDLYTLTPTVMPHGGMLSTAEDMGKFIIAMLNQGQAASGQILSAESVADMFKYRSMAHSLMPNTTYGFEAASQIPLAGSNQAIVSKAGDLPGNSSYLLLIPEQQTGVFLTYNKQGVLRELFYQQFIATFFPDYTEAASLDAFEPASVEALQKLSGIYSDLRLSVLVTQISVEDEGSLIISDAILGPRTLRQVDDHLFVDELTKQYTAFPFDERNGIYYMKEPYLNPLGYAKQGEKPVGFTDVAEDHPYAAFIYQLQSLGIYPNEPGKTFEAEREVSRAEFLQEVLALSMIPASQSSDYAFTDVAGHPHAGYIQAAFELGMVAGNGEGEFFPDRAITRQEMAVMIWNLLRLQYPDELFEHVPLAGETAAWAVPAVKMMVAFGYYGPEVLLAEDGAVDFLSTKSLTRQEAAAIYFKLLIQPTDQIAYQLSTQQ